MWIFDKNLTVVSFYFHIKSPERNTLGKTSINQALNDNQYTWLKKKKKAIICSNTAGKFRDVNTTEVVISCSQKAAFVIEDDILLLNTSKNFKDPHPQGDYMKITYFFCIAGILEFYN